MHISGVLLSAHQDNMTDVVSSMKAFSNVEVHAIDSKSGKIVITIEDSDDDNTSVYNTFTEISKADGVLSASLVYDHNEPDNINQENIS